MVTYTLASLHPYTLALLDQKEILSICFKGGTLDVHSTTSLSS